LRRQDLKALFHGLGVKNNNSGRQEERHMKQKREGLSDQLLVQEL
jgi:hypothetical protein